MTKLPSWSAVELKLGRGLEFNPVGFPFSDSDSPWYRSGLTPMEVKGLPDLANHNFSVIQSM